MKLPPPIQDSVENIYKKTNPLSVFLYGSRAREDHRQNSDFEVGLIYPEKSRVRREDLAAMHTFSNLNLYSFTQESLKKYSIEVPFPKIVFLRELFENGSVVLLGKSLKEIIGPPPVSVSDMFEEVVFNRARSLGSLLSFRNKDVTTATDQIVKACAYALKMYLLLKTKQLFSRYDIVFTHPELIKLEPEYQNTFSRIYEIRMQKKPLDLNLIFSVMTVIDKKVYEPVKKLASADPHAIILL